jgi:hypothetical protein
MIIAGEKTRPYADTLSILTLETAHVKEKLIMHLYFKSMGNQFQLPIDLFPISADPYGISFSSTAFRTGNP